MARNHLHNLYLYSQVSIIDFQLLTDYLGVAKAMEKQKQYEDKKRQREEDGEDGSEEGKKKKRKRKKKVFDEEKEVDGMSLYSNWAPPTGQTGDGRTFLNDKFGY